tara:strand:- start:2628 stop:3368 length:741 start_codon:yes stop_codon:yes gene_type:complete
MKKCNWCRKLLQLSSFEEYKGTKRATCIDCVPKKKDTNQKYQGSAKGIKKSKEYWKSDVGKKVRQNYNGSDKGKAAHSKFMNSDKGVKAKKKQLTTYKEKYNTNASFNLNMRLCALFRYLLKNDAKESELLHLTDFDSVADVDDHFQKLFKDGMSFENYGMVWSVAHRIPRIYFNHDDPEDVRRCWSPKNMYPEAKTKNKEDSFIIDLEGCTMAGNDHFPLNWNGVVPNAAKIQELQGAARKGELC